MKDHIQLSVTNSTIIGGANTACDASRQYGDEIPPHRIHNCFIVSGRKARPAALIEMVDGSEGYKIGLQNLLILDGEDPYYCFRQFIYHRAAARTPRPVKWTYRRTVKRPVRKIKHKIRNRKDTNDAVKF